MNAPRSWSPKLRLLLRRRDARDLPAAEEERARDAAHHEDVRPLGEEEEQVAHARVLGGVAGDELALRLGQVERRAVALGERRREVEEEERERDRVAEHEPVPGPAADLEERGPAPPCAPMMSCSRSEPVIITMHTIATAPGIS